jgi:hypothetical protein
MVLVGVHWLAAAATFAPAAMPSVVGKRISEAARIRHRKRSTSPKR